MALLVTAKSGVALRHAQAIHLLMTACGIDPSARTAFDARIRQLQRLGMSRRDYAVPAGRIDYGIVELGGLATAVRLMAAFMVPSLAARYVTERWTVLVPALMAGAGSALPTEYVVRRSIGKATMIVIAGGALSDLGRQKRHDERYTGALSDLILTDRAVLADTMEELGGAGLAIDTATYMPAIVKGFAAETMATSHELAHQLDRLRFSA